MNLGRRLLVQWWIIAILVSLLAIFLTAEGSLSRIDNLAYDHLLKFDDQKPDNEIVLVEIDDESLARVGRWPWKRDIHAALIDRLGAASPRAIVYDTLFTEASDPADDAKLGAAMRRAGAVFVPLLLSDSRQTDTAIHLLEPIPAVRDAAAGTGFTDYMVGSDGAVRSVVLELRAAPVQRHLMDVVRRALEPGTAKGNPGEMIPFGGRERWQRIHASAILDGDTPTQSLRGKIVLVGVTASGIGPRYPVPGRGTLPGLDIDAQLLRGLLDHHMIIAADLHVRIAFALVPLWLLMLAMGPFPRVPALLALALAAGAIIATTTIALLHFRIWLSPGAALLALGIAHPVWGWRQLAVTHRFMRRELQLLEQDPLILPRHPLPSHRERLPSTIALLTAAIADNRSMKHFIADRLDQLPDATIVTNDKGDILLANAFARKQFGEEGMRTDPAASILPLLARFKEAGSHDAVPFPAAIADTPLAYEAVTGDGHFYAIRFAPQRSVTGNFAGWIVQFMDVSEAKAAQRQRDDILELLTHDMRSPQASILAVLETAPAENIAPEEARRIRHYAERTLGLADGFVQLARAEVLDYALEEVAFGEMVIDAIDDLWPQLSAKSITIETRELDERLIVEVERSLLTRALINVLDNAIKYSPAGSHIRCTLSREFGPGGMARAACAIADQGFGLDDEHKHRIFDRFHQGPLGVGRKADGVGLGLSFVHTVLVRHGGEIRCESEPGQGTVFTFILPLADQHDRPDI